VADLVILDRDIMAIADHDEIKDVAVLSTICGGRVVFSAGA
jgi:predicted amidohydrolase YtcJ